MISRWQSRTLREIYFFFYSERERERIKGLKRTLQNACGLEMHDVKIFPGYQLMIFLLNPLAMHMVLDFRWFDVKIFNPMMVQKRQAFSRKCTWNLEFWASPGLAVCSTILSGDAGQGSSLRSQAAPPSRRWATDTLTTIPPLFFTFSTVFDPLDEISNTSL